MKKRHHSMPKHHMAEYGSEKTGHAKSEMNASRPSSGEYEGPGMIKEDRRAIANLPQEVMIKAYAPMPGFLPEDLDDTIRGIDHQMEGDHKAAKGGLHPEKF
jgi:hypothetical protein